MPEVVSWLSAHPGRGLLFAFLLLSDVVGVWALWRERPGRRPARLAVVSPRTDDAAATAGAVEAAALVVDRDALNLEIRARTNALYHP